MEMAGGYSKWKESWEGDYQQDGKYGNISHYFSFSIDVIENDGKRIIRGEGKDGQKSFEITGEYDTSNPTIEFLMTYLPLYKNKFVKFRGTFKSKTVLLGNWAGREWEEDKAANGTFDLHLKSSTK